VAETLTITSDEVEAVAARIDADEPLDARDKAILRGVFVLAGRAAATAEQDETLIAAALAGPASSDEGADEVGGYAFDFGPTTPGVSLELGFTGPVTDAAKGSFSASHRLMEACCKGRHIPEAKLE
jgi:hypothetical protein